MFHTLETRDGEFHSVPHVLNTLSEMERLPRWPAASGHRRQLNRSLLSGASHTLLLAEQVLIPLITCCCHVFLRISQRDGRESEWSQSQESPYSFPFSPLGMHLNGQTWGVGGMGS